jgi:hypothetical protein
MQVNIYILIISINTIFIKMAKSVRSEYSAVHEKKYILKRYLKITIMEKEEFKICQRLHIKQTAE